MKKKMNKWEETTLLDWWQRVCLPAEQLEKEKQLPSGYQAQLKRCDSIYNAMFTEGFHLLWQRLQPQIADSATEPLLDTKQQELKDKKNAKNKELELKSWAMIAAVLVYVKQHHPDKSLAKAAGEKNKEKGNDKSVVSETRFFRLLNAQTDEELLFRLRRMIQQVKGSLDVVKLAQDIRQWFWEKQQYSDQPPYSLDDVLSIRWAMEYYQNAMRA